MGKRKGRKAPPKSAKVPKLDKEFNCPFCNHTKSIEVKIDRQRELGNLWCRICSVSYSVDVTRHDVAIDVYSAWIDNCYQVNKPVLGTSNLKSSNQLTSNIEDNFEKYIEDGAQDDHSSTNGELHGKERSYESEAVPSSNANSDAPPGGSSRGNYRSSSGNRPEEKRRRLLRFNDDEDTLQDEDEFLRTSGGNAEDLFEEED